MDEKIIEVRCNHCGRIFDKHAVRKCPYSASGLIVCMWCCRLCPYVTWSGSFQLCDYPNRRKEK
jgi:hypothetical protein